MVFLGRTYKISVLPGDGIGREVIPQAIRTLEIAEELVGGFTLKMHNFECGGEYYLRTKTELSDEGMRFTKAEADAILLGAIGAEDSDGNPVRLPDNNLAGYNVVIGLRMELDLYANVRPVKLFEGVPTPLAAKDIEIDMVIIRENTEGLYAPVRGNLSRGGSSEVAIDTRVITEKGSKRISEYAFDTASARNGAPVDGKKRVTCVDKSNLLAGCQLFRKSFDLVSNNYPHIEPDYAYVDAFAQWLIRKPEYYDVAVAPNAFGDIVTDIGAAIQGGLGVAPAGSIGDKHAVFEPVHGSAPKHYGKDIANPIASILATSMMLEWLGEKRNDDKCTKASEVIREGVTSVLREGSIRTYDLCKGKWQAIKPSTTTQITDAIIQSMKDIADSR